MALWHAFLRELQFPLSVSFHQRSIFIHLPPTLYNVFLPVLQFPQSVSFHQCSTLIHSPITDAVQYNKNKALCRLHNMRHSAWCERHVLYTSTRLTGLVRIWTYNVSDNKSVGFINNSVHLVYLNPIKPSSYYMHRQFNSHQFYVLSTVYLCVLCGYENQQRLFPYTALTGWFL
jgi:hypothetical protein